MDHTPESHLLAVNSLCRLCGRLNQSEKDKKIRAKPKPIEHFASELTLMGFRYNTDIDGVHSKFVCLKCTKTFHNIKKRKCL